ncbi:c-type cytochrome [Chitinophaga japonensis]|uniref:Cytochrome c n=1 Tax=Chitinophaga japonensis TaxID=104662 RepID=A0A562SNM7_CHIJA|nr:cytochrome c [Chitinophaga japonensis]TWI82534.1 cytochrome c [Chitinophaga japonensis]
MHYKHFFSITFTAGILFIYGCGGGSTQQADTRETPAATPAGETGTTAGTADDKKGIGKFTDVPLTHPLDAKMVTAGEKTYDVKCGSCHKLSEEKLVGPGWKGVTDRRTPEWIMNFITNVDEMLNKDAEAQAMLEICMVRMPNQNLSDEEARAVLEFMRKNDGKN